jgi:hypothetical protein
MSIGIMMRECSTLELSKRIKKKDELKERGFVV